MEITDEQLIAYLLGDASEELRTRIDDALSRDSSIVERLSHLRFVIGQIDSLNLDAPDGGIEPPSDLVETTMSRIDREMADPRPPLHLPETRNLSSAAGAPTNRSNWLDSSVLSLSLVAVCCLLLPAVLKVRSTARRAQCAQNLDNVGTKLVDYALHDPDRRFPQVPISGPEAFAGVYAISISAPSQPLAQHVVYCPSLGIERPQRAGPIINSRQELHQLGEAELVRIQQTIGGDYAYSLGVVEGKKIVAPKYEGRSHFAILADAPQIDRFSSAQPDQFIAHGGQGINILFEDGRVVFVSLSALTATSPTVDNPFRNQRNTHEAGLTPHDASLAPSHFPPVAN